MPRVAFYRPNRSQPYRTPTEEAMDQNVELSNQYKSYCDFWILEKKKYEEMANGSIKKEMIEYAISEAMKCSNAAMHYEALSVQCDMIALKLWAEIQKGRTIPR
jgi:hypothetical protein